MAKKKVQDVGLTDDEKLIAEVKKFVENTHEDQREAREKGLQNIKFVMCDDQWDATIKSSRENQMLPVLTINRLRPFVEQIVNEQRRNQLAIKFSPKSGKASKEIAEIKEGISRDIESNSMADVAYAEAFKFAITAGFPAYWRIISRYADQESFNQELLIRFINDPFAVYFDHRATLEPDYSDARKCVILENMPESVFEVTYPDAESTSADWIGPMDETPLINEGEKFIRVAEYFWRKETVETLYELTDGRVLEKGEFEKELEDWGAANESSAPMLPGAQPSGAPGSPGSVSPGAPPVPAATTPQSPQMPAPVSPPTGLPGANGVPGGAVVPPSQPPVSPVPPIAAPNDPFANTDLGFLAQPVPKPEIATREDGTPKERERLKPVIHWAKITGKEVLERNIWDGKQIPIIPMEPIGMEVEGKKVWISMVQGAKDPQRIYNYFVSKQTEVIALAPKAPFLATPAMIGEHLDEWQNMNHSPNPFLLYEVDPKAQGAGGMPTKMPPIEVPQSIVQAIVGAQDDIKTTMGMRDPAMANDSNETSGVAIEARQREGDTGNYGYMANLARAIRVTGLMLEDLIPKFYDGDRIVRVLGLDGAPKNIRVNMAVAGEILQNDLSEGEYDVTVTVGPSYSTQRAQSRDSMMEFMKAAPQTIPAIVDLVARAQDWEPSEEIADRLHAMLPPGVANAQQTGGNQPPPPPNPALILEQAKVQTEQLRAKSEADKMQAESQMRQMDLKEKEIDLQISMVEAEARLHEAKARITMATMPPANMPGIMPQGGTGNQMGGL